MVRSDNRRSAPEIAAVLTFMDLTPLEQAELFRSLHDPEHPLALSNAFDVAGAVVTEAAGAPAIATSSAGVAWSLGYPDGDRLGRVQALSVVAAIAGAVRVPVTADIEGGYGDAVPDVAETVRGVLDAGAVGINIEDGSRPPAELAARIGAARRVAEHAGVPLYINARTDVFLAGVVPPDRRRAETLARAARYLDAGADGIFVPGVVDPDTIATLAGQLNAPLNIMVGPGAPSVAELGRLGVARVSLGSAVAQAAYATVRRITRELYEHGTYRAASELIDFAELNTLMGRSSAP